MLDYRTIFNFGHAVRNQHGYYLQGHIDLAIVGFLADLPCNFGYVGQECFAILAQAQANNLELELSDNQRTIIWRAFNNAFQNSASSIVVTRHSSLVTYLKELNLVPSNVDVLAHVDNPAQILGRRVFGVLPLNLARFASQVVEIPLAMPAELRGKELTLEQMRQFAQEPLTFQVTCDYL